MSDDLVSRLRAERRLPESPLEAVDNVIGIHSAKKVLAQ